jgi:hypothetical protein
VRPFVLQEIKTYTCSVFFLFDALEVETVAGAAQVLLKRLTCLEFFMSKTFDQ